MRASFLFQTKIFISNKNRRHRTPGEAYFPHRRTRKYHRNLALLLPSSEWDRVGHAKLNHQEIDTGNFFNQRLPLRKIVCS